MTRILASTLLATTFLLLGIAASAEPPDPGFKVLNKLAIGGEGSWDYLTIDPAAHRLYVPRGNRVLVIDVDAGKVVGEVSNTPGIHGVALAPKIKRGFTSNGGENSVTIFDLESLKETGRVKVGNRPDGILYDPASDRVFTFNAGSSDATAIAAADGTVAGTVKLGGKPESSVSDEKGMIFVNIEDKNEVVAFDAKELAVKHRWPLGEGKRAVGLAMDRAKRRLFSTCGNEKMVVLEADTGKILATLKIGRGTDYAAFDPELGLAFSSNGADGTLTVVAEDSATQYAVAANLPTQAGARTMALDPKAHRLYLPTARFKAPAAGEQGRRRTMEPDSFVILVVGK